MTFEQILKDLKNKVYYPVYFLSGEEPYFIDLISDYIEKNVLDDMEKEFNQQVLYGLDTNVDFIIGEAKRFPMMSNHNVVIVKEAQNLKKIESLDQYVQNPQKTTILVLCYKYGKLDKRTSFSKNLSKNGVVLETKKLFDNKMPNWVIAEAKRLGFQVSPRVAQTITEFLGNDLTKISSELDRISVNLESGKEITAEVVEKNMGLNRSYTYFELNNALGVRASLKSNQIANYFAGNEKQYPFLVIISTLFLFFSQILKYQFLKDKSRNNVVSELGVHPFFVKDYSTAASNYTKTQVVEIISLLRQYDLKAKGVDNPSTNNAELLRELIFRILHA